MRITMSTLLFIGILTFGFCAGFLMSKSLMKKDFEAYAGWACAVVWMIAYLIKPVIIIAG